MIQPPPLPTHGVPGPVPPPPQNQAQGGDKQTLNGEAYVVSARGTKCSISMPPPNHTHFQCHIHFCILASQIEYELLARWPAPTHPNRRASSFYFVFLQPGRPVQPSHPLTHTPALGIGRPCRIFPWLPSTGPLKVCLGPPANLPGWMDLCHGFFPGDNRASAWGDGARSPCHRWVPHSLN